MKKYAYIIHLPSGPHLAGPASSWSVLRKAAKELLANLVSDPGERDAIYETITNAITNARSAEMEASKERRALDKERKSRPVTYAKAHSASFAFQSKPTTSNPVPVEEPEEQVFELTRSQKIKLTKYRSIKEELGRLFGKKSPRYTELNHKRKLMEKELADVLAQLEKQRCKK